MLIAYADSNIIEFSEKKGRSNNSILNISYALQQKIIVVTFFIKVVYTECITLQKKLQ